MKKIRILSALLVFIYGLSACASRGPSPEEQAEIDQFNKWQAQVEEIAPLLEASLYDSFIIDVDVYQLSGEISANIEILSCNVDRYYYGTIIGLMGNRFFELIEEYNDYSFDHITFCYYYTNRNGKKYTKTADITYDLKSDGTSRFIEPGADIPALYDKTPDDIYYFLSGNSPENEFGTEADLTRSIPNPTLKQEALVPTNTFAPADEIIFELPASENGLEDTPFYIEGTVVSRFDLSSYDTIRLSTEYGELFVSDVFIPLPQEVSEGDRITVYFVYTGMSTEFGLPCSAYVYHEW